MMQISSLPLLGTALLWLVIFVFKAIRFEGSALSSFELNRRSEQGDVEAKSIVERERFLPRMITLHSIISTVLVVIATALTISAVGWFFGVVFACIGTLLIGKISRHKLATSLAMKAYSPYQERVSTLVSTWTWLDWFKDANDKGVESVAASKEELQYTIERSKAVLSGDELQRILASLALDQRTVHDVMTPVSVIETADISDSLGPLVLDSLHKTGHSRFPVVNGDVHHIEGILYLHDIINLKSAKKSVREAMDSRVHYIHEEQSLEHALHGFLRTHRHLFVVVNDYRETVGVVTLEDVLESLLGKKIIDEFDQFDDLRLVASSNPRKNNLPKGKTDI